jgi:hypothetical protein
MRHSPVSVTGREWRRRGRRPVVGVRGMCFDVWVAYAKLDGAVGPAYTCSDSRQVLLWIFKHISNNWVFVALVDRPRNFPLYVIKEEDIFSDTQRNYPRGIGKVDAA